MGQEQHRQRDRRAREVPGQDRVLPLPHRYGRTVRHHPRGRYRLISVQKSRRIGPKSGSAAFKLFPKIAIH